VQFYLNGYTPGDPDIAEEKVPAAVDVLVVGSGPAGALLAAQLSNLPGISTAGRAARRGAAGRTGGLHRVPHGGDVRGLRARSEAGSRSY
jgi:choline dehydrogenase-like flavoprotein